MGNRSGVTTYLFTAYFENEVLRKRPHLRREWCIITLEDQVTIHNAFLDRRFKP